MFLLTSLLQGVKNFALGRNYSERTSVIRLHQTHTNLSEHLKFSQALISDEIKTKQVGLQHLNNKGVFRHQFPLKSLEQDCSLNQQDYMDDTDVSVWGGMRDKLRVNATVCRIKHLYGVYPLQDNFPLYGFKVIVLLWLHF